MDGTRVPSILDDLLRMIASEALTKREQAPSISRNSAILPVELKESVLVWLDVQHRTISFSYGVSRVTQASPRRRYQVIEIHCLRQWLVVGIIFESSRSDRIATISQQVHGTWAYPSPRWW